ncbi:MAG: homing endonuclease associated repeat-containing protein [Salinirussus sp.]
MGQEELIEHLQELAAELGKSPTTEEMHEHGEYTAQAYYYYFDTWDEALTAAGLETTTTTRADLIEELHSIQDSIGQPSSWAAAISDHGTEALSRYYAEFGDLDSALEAAGIDPERPSPISKDEITEEISRLATDGTPPTTDQMDAEGAYSARTCADRFGTWNEAVRAAGYEPLTTSDERTEKELLEEIERLADEGGGPPTAPTTRDMREHGKYTASVYFRRFESWNEAVRKAGFTPNERVLDPAEQRIPVSELVDELERVADQVGGRPTSDDMLASGKFSITPYEKRFGSWNNALEVAGFRPFTGTTEDLFTREELLTELQRLGEEVGRPPTTEQMHEQGRYSTSPYQNVFGSWIDALREAGFEPTTAQLRPHTGSSTTESDL